jgi:hypothetical protein
VRDLAIEDFFDHKCDIYHSKKETVSPGYNLPGSPKFSYGSVPDIENVDCHFHVKNSSITIVQEEVVNRYEDHVKLALPAGTDIRLNDRVINRDTGLVYTAELPRNIRDHHIAVYLQRAGAIKEAL